MQIAPLIHGLHEFVHFCALGIGVLPELSRDGEGIHLGKWGRSMYGIESLEIVIEILYRKQINERNRTGTNEREMHRCFRVPTG